MIDLLVAGGGPAGLATAIFAAADGMRVTIVEPQSGPIDKACGEGIMPAGCSLLRQMGLGTLPGRPFLGVRYHRNGTIATGRFKSPGMGIQRTELSRLLWERAEALGVERICGRVRQVAGSNGCVSVDGLQAGWLVAADGLYSTIRNGLGIPLVRDRRGRFGTRRHFWTQSDSEFVDVYLGDDEEAYVTPVAKGLVGVAVLTPEPKRFETSIQAFPSLLERLGEPVGNVRGAGPFRRFAERVTKGRVVLVGDAAGFLDPITGEGMRLGFESARLAVDCIRRGDLDPYDAGWRKIVRPYRLLTSTILALRRNRYSREAMVPFLKSAPFAFDRILGLLGDA